jgi:hypothetical protein
MKQILFSLLLFCLITAIGQNCYGQGTAGQHNPYQNLAKWYGTQSVPSDYEKAQWALDDINAYRTAEGLKPLPESIIKMKNWDVIFILFILIFLANLFLFCFYVREFIILKQAKIEKQKERTSTLSVIHDLVKKRQKFDQTVQEIMCGKPVDPETFPIIWDGLIESRRRANIGTFVQIYKREPSEKEIVTGEINNDKT